jgi:hypothetical protein
MMMSKGAVKTANNNKMDWIAVHPGLFDYPVKKKNKAVLKASRCSRCGETFFPERSYCRYCLDESQITNITLASRGLIHASTIVYVDAPSGIKAPYAIGYVDIPENGVRIFALFDSCDRELLAPGREVELLIGPISMDTDGKKIIGYKFAPAQRKGFCK